MKKYVVLLLFLGIIAYSCDRSVLLEITLPQIISGDTGIDLIENTGAGQTVYAVSYTHLTLPTKA